MAGFFDTNKSRIKLDIAKNATCAHCGMYKGVRSPRMPAFGNFKKRIMNVGEAPGEVEDMRNRPWQGKMGQALQRAYANLGVDLFDDCINVNSCNCRPLDSEGNNRTPTDAEIAACRNRVLKVIMEYKPNVIVALGQCALTSLLGHRWKRDIGTISQWRGWTIPDREFGAWFCPTFHPSFVERGDLEVETIWKQDLELALAMASIPQPEWTDEAKQIEIVNDLSFLDELTGPVAFDYETTGLKPHDVSKHRVVCMSVCNNINKAYSFLINPEDHNQRRAIRMFLKSDIPKIAQNMKFEHTWSKYYFNCEVNNWQWDTMLATHILDNRPAITGLKFQTYVQFGVIDYDSGVSPYLKGKDPKNANSVNTIDELIKTQVGRHKLAIYCGMDSLFEYRLAIKQQMEFVEVENDVRR